MLDSDETMTRDFLDSEHKKRFLNVQLFSYFVLSVGIVIVTTMDALQKPLDIQYVTMFFECFMFLCLYLGHPSMKLLAVASYVIRFLTIIIWGWKIMRENDL